MSNPKSLIEAAMRHKREAYVERICRNPPVLAHVWEREADRLLTLPGPPDVGVGGEVVRQHSGPNGDAQDVLKREMEIKRANIRDTLAEGATRVAEEASIRRTDLLMQPSFDALMPWRSLWTQPTASTPATASKRCSRIRWPWLMRRACA